MGSPKRRSAARAKAEGSRAKRLGLSVVAVVTFGWVVLPQIPLSNLPEHRAFPGIVFLSLICSLWMLDVFGMRKERMWRRTKLRPRARMRFGERGAATTCAYCHDGFEPDDPAGDCPGCEAVYHDECLTELGGCATLGCEEARPRVRLTKPTAKEG